LQLAILGAWPAGHPKQPVGRYVRMPATRLEADPSGEGIVRAILNLRGHKVLLDETLAMLYGVETRLLVQAVKRNLDRFPSDFLFQISPEELESLRSQFVISNVSGRGGRRYLPYAFTEQGVAMLSSVLRSKQAVRANIEIMRAFVRLRGLMAANRELAAKFDELEKRVSSHDQAITGIFSAIRQLMAPPNPQGRPIGFVTPEDKPGG
jgi:hypothetical protein